MFGSLNDMRCSPSRAGTRDQPPMPTISSATVASCRREAESSFTTATIWTYALPRTVLADLAGPRFPAFRGATKQGLIAGNVRTSGHDRRGMMSQAQAQVMTAGQGIV